MRRRSFPAKGRDKAALALSAKRAALVNARIDSHGSSGLNEWLKSNNVLGWSTYDASEALATIRRRLGVEVWRAALDVVGVV